MPYRPRKTPRQSLVKKIATFKKSTACTVGAATLTALSAIGDGGEDLFKKPLRGAERVAGWGMAAIDGAAGTVASAFENFKGPVHMPYGALYDPTEFPRHVVTANTSIVEFQAGTATYRGNV